MFENDPRCVYLAATDRDAQQVVLFLELEGIAAEVKQGISMERGASFAVAGGEESFHNVPVWVELPRADEARSLLAHFPAWLKTHDEHKENLGPVTAECEDCGQSSEFPGAERGTVQTCPYCQSFLDVPGDDDDAYDWSEAESMPPDDAYQEIDDEDDIVF